ncbi:MAG: uracil-DNA glycosylase [Pseudomonadota bacterium]
MGADEALEESPIDRFAQEAPPPEQPKAAPASAKPPEVEQRAASTPLATTAQDLDGLRAAMEGFDGCALKQGARNLVFSDGQAAARVMIVGEAPGREEDRIGKPFVGRSGQLLDAMFAAIGLARDAEDPAHALHITNTLPWRPPQNRDPSTDEIAMMKPFLLRHIELADPEVLVLMGNPATKTLLDTKTGITRMRGIWAEVLGRPALPMFHPAALLRDPTKKALAWADLLALKTKLEAP